MPSIVTRSAKPAGGSVEQIGRPPAVQVGVDDGRVGEVDHDREASDIRRRGAHPGASRVRRAVPDAPSPSRRSPRRAAAVAMPVAAGKFAGGCRRARSPEEPEQEHRARRSSPPGRGGRAIAQSTAASIAPKTSSPTYGSDALDRRSRPAGRACRRCRAASRDRRCRATCPAGRRSRRTRQRDRRARATVGRAQRRHDCLIRAAGSAVRVTSAAAAGAANGDDQRATPPCPGSPCASGVPIALERAARRTPAAPATSPAADPADRAPRRRGGVLRAVMARNAADDERQHEGEDRAPAQRVGPEETRHALARRPVRSGTRPTRQ